MRSWELSCAAIIRPRLRRLPACRGEKTSLQKVGAGSSGCGCFTSYSHTSCILSHEDENVEASTFKPTVNLSAAKDLFSGLDMALLPDKREAVTRFLTVAREEGINVGADDNEAKIKLGTLVMSNSTLGPEELLSLAESNFGTIRSSRAKQARASTGTVCEGNEG